MTDYTAPLADMRFILNNVAGMAEIAALPGYQEATPDLVDAVLEEAGRFGSEVLAPLNRPGDLQGSHLENGVVRTPDGFAEAYRRFSEGGWNSIIGDPQFGGQGLPWLLAAAVNEIWSAANMAFGVGVNLSQSAILLLETLGTEEQQSLYLPKLNSGEWTATMNLTEPQAGSDLGLLRTKAVRENGAYRISGQKIFITYGDSDWADNIVHLVLARTPDAPAGVKGISLFIVPKFIVGADGSLGPRNDLRPISLEHKLGIRASPTCVMSYGDDGGAVGQIIGGENRGLEGMFLMMNATRLMVGIQGVGIGERAYQQALSYARERVQGRPDDGLGKESTAIINHADVKRMLLAMKAKNEAGRALSLYTAAYIDMAYRHPDDRRRQDCGERAALLTPLVKAWCSDLGIDVASTGIQVHGGTGFIEETGAAQHYRDARIAAIYEGTNGIQANDLVGRKVARDDGLCARELIAEMREIDGALAAAGDEPAIAAIGEALKTGLDALSEATDWLVANFADNRPMVFAGAVHYLHLMASVAGGWLLARGALAAHAELAANAGDADFLKGKLASARFYADQILDDAPGLKAKFMGGAAAVIEIADSQF